ncbi:hypothetical protein BC941DRAFT_346817 [Chlamydoabsidia padenii]|nr:hypothetical protein BC941DRAFT_346817 [Chlamydoabsidia padenii]
MSLNRPRSIGRSKAPRSLTLPASLYNPTSSSSLLQDPSPTVTASVSSSTGVDLSFYLPSMEESLQDWLTRNIPDTANNSPSSLSSLLHEACPCCGKHDCEHMEKLYKTMRKLESDTRLAAEIGQGLLHKHEALVAETNQTKEVLEEQMYQYSNRLSLSSSFMKAVQETMIDLERATERSIEIGNELKNKTKEVEKLRIFKFMVRQADYREDMLRSQLEDTNQELAISRKNELMLESKYKKLKERYGKLV